MIQIGDTRIPTEPEERGWDPDRKLETVRIPCGCAAHKDDPEFYVIYLQPGETLPEGTTFISFVKTGGDLERVSKSQTFVADIFSHKGGAEAYFEQSTTRVRRSVTVIGIGGLGSLFEDDELPFDFGGSPFGDDADLRDLLRQAGLGERGGSIFDLLGRIRRRRNPFGG